MVKRSFSFNLLITVSSLIIPMISPSFILKAYPQDTGQNPSGPRGIFSLLRKDEVPSSALLKLDNLSGVNIRTGWRKIEKKEGQFNWSFIDQSITKSRQANKSIMLTVVSGVGTPDWVYESGSTSFSFKDRNPYHRVRGEPLRIPVPWDEVFLRKWGNFVAELGKRYNDESTITLIHMVGPASMSPEMHLPKGPGNRSRWEELGYHSKKLVNAWKKVIDSYFSAFPNKAISIQIAIPIYNDGSLEKILEYGTKTYGNRFVIQGDWLTAHTKDDFPLYKLIKEYSMKTTIGFEMIGPSGQPKKSQKRRSEEQLSHQTDDRERKKSEIGANDEQPTASIPKTPLKEKGPRGMKGSRLGSLRGAIERGLHAGAQYLIIYQPDLLNPELSKDIEFAANRLN